jgi:hypothetical protein
MAERRQWRKSGGCHLPLVPETPFHFYTRLYQGPSLVGTLCNYVTQQRLALLRAVELGNGIDVPIR